MSLLNFDVKYNHWYFERIYHRDKSKMINLRRENLALKLQGNSYLNKTFDYIYNIFIYLLDLFIGFVCLLFLGLV